MAISSQHSPSFAFFVFHISVGTRIALRTLAPIIAVIFASYYILRYDFFLILARSFFLDSSILISGLFFSIISLSTAAIAAPRVSHGLTGWIRHLPLDSLTSRRLTNIAIFTAQIPILFVLIFLAFTMSKSLEESPLPYLVGIPLLGIASSFFVTPVQQKTITKLLAVVACVFSASGNWLLIISACLLITGIDLVSGHLSPIRKQSTFRRAFKGIPLPFIISLRAIRIRIFFPYVLSFPVMGAVYIFLANNDPNPTLTVISIRLGGSLSISIFVSLLANMLAVRRPPWPWIRSLPWSAKQRVLFDSLFLLFPSIPILIFVSIMSIKASFPIVCSIPLLVVYSSQVMRHTSELRMGAAGKILMFSIPGAMMISLIPLTSLALLSLTPVAFFIAAREENSQKVSRWLEMHHLSAGDSLSWSK